MVTKKVRGSLKGLGRGINKVVKDQQKRYRSYMRYYEKLSLYGQGPTSPLSHPWQRDVDRLKARWKTVQKYVKAYEKLKQNVGAFNETFLDNVELPEIPVNITEKSLEALRERAKKFRMTAKRIEKRVSSEDTLIVKNLEDLIRTAFDYARPSRHTAAGEMTPHQQHVYRQATRLREFIKDVIPEEQPARRIKLSQIKRDWELLRRACEVFFYDSDQARVAEAWAQINFILTGRGSGEDEIYDLWED